MDTHEMDIEQLREHNVALVRLLAVYRQEFGKMYFPSDTFTDVINKAEEQYARETKRSEQDTNQG